MVKEQARSEHQHVWLHDVQLLRRERPLRGVLERSTQEDSSETQLEEGGTLPAWAPTRYLAWYVSTLTDFQREHQLSSSAMVACLKELIR
jgi:hypothetical protein